MSKYILPTFTGIEFDLWSPTINMISIEDIAHHLSLINRFCGATRFPYSVGYHSILVAKQLPEHLILEGLLHDARETYIHDLTAPFKQLMKDENFKENNCEDFYTFKDMEISVLIGQKFNLKGDRISWGYEHEEINAVDKRMGVTEIGQLLTKFDRDKWMPNYQICEPFSIQIMERDWKNVEQEFLDLYNKYKRT